MLWFKKDNSALGDIFVAVISIIVFLIIPFYSLSKYEDLASNQETHNRTILVYKDGKVIYSFTGKMDIWRIPPDSLFIEKQDKHKTRISFNLKDIKYNVSFVDKSDKLILVARIISLILLAIGLCIVAASLVILSFLTIKIIAEFINKD
jgi:DNA-dependent RNA polymerase auxiliary subunit epsilon